MTNDRIILNAYTQKEIRWNLEKGNGMSPSIDHWLVKNKFNGTRLI